MIKTSLNKAVRALSTIGLTMALLAGMSVNSFAADTINVKIVHDTDIQLQSGDIFYVSYTTDSGDTQKFKLDASQLVDADGSITVDSISSVVGLKYVGKNKNLEKSGYEAFLIDSDSDVNEAGSGVSTSDTASVCIAIGSKSISTVTSEIQNQDSSSPKNSGDSSTTENEHKNDSVLSFFGTIFSRVDTGRFFHAVGRNALIVGGILGVGLLIAWILKLTGRIF